MKLPLIKTKIICTIGPVSRTPEMIEAMVKNGMSIARLNFSHGTLKEHLEDIQNVRLVAKKLNCPIGIIIDLPGAKIRIGRLSKEFLTLKPGQKLRLTKAKNVKSENDIPVEYKYLAQSVKPGHIIFINDGFIQLKVDSTKGDDVHCHVIIGGKLLSHKGLNLPGAKLFVDAITPKDLEFVRFGLEHGVNTFGLSFVETASDVMKVRNFVKKLGKRAYLIAKIERAEAITNFDSIIKVADGVMIARGDLGVEIPLEEVPTVQKMLIIKANAMGRPVITATQMLESMTHNIRPTRAEVTDIANAILDGTDAIMLSEETAIGQYPKQAIAVMSKVAQSIEQQRDRGLLSNDESVQIRHMVSKMALTITDVITLNVVRSAQELNVAFIFTPTSGGSTARRISRFKPHCWILAFTSRQNTFNFLNFSYGTFPFLVSPTQKSSHNLLMQLAKKKKLIRPGDVIAITERRLSDRSGETDTLGINTVE